MSVRHQFKSASTVADRRLAAVRGFVAEHAAALTNASRLLGGEPAARDCVTLIADLAETPHLSPSIRRRLVGLRALLSLEHVGDPDRTETARFAAIDPADPRIDALCLLADRLGDLIDRISAPDIAGDSCEAGDLAQPRASSARARPADTRGARSQARRAG